MAPNGNVWLQIPLQDYEAHMALPAVAQASMIADQLEKLLAEEAPDSVAVIGCSGGNGFDRLPEGSSCRVIGVDINPGYLEAARARYQAALPGLELYTADIQDDRQIFTPVRLVYAALIFEYLDIPSALRTLRRHCAPAGLLAVLLQKPHRNLAAVSDSGYASLMKLAPVMRLVEDEELADAARQVGFNLESVASIVTPAGKEFSLQRYRA